VPTALTAQHGLGRVALGGAGSRRQHRIDDQAAPVLHQQMAHMAELGLLAPAPAEEPWVGIGGRGVRLVAAPLAVKVALGIAPTACRRSLVTPALRLEALHAGEGLDQGAIDREVLVRE
jgi:hypothetical protein